MCSLLCPIYWPQQTTWPLSLCVCMLYVFILGMWFHVEARGHCWVSSVWLHWLAKELQGSSCFPPTPSTGFQCWDSRLTWLFCGFRDPDLSSCRPQQSLYPRNCVCSLLLSLLSRGSCADWPFQGLCPDFRPTYTMWLPPQEGETAGRLASLSAERSWVLLVSSVKGHVRDAETYVCQMCLPHNWISQFVM